MTRLRVIVAHQASYANPIAFRAGDRIVLTGREDLWDGHRWLWAGAPDGREGWIPDSFAGGSASFAAPEDYSAGELTCAKGAIVTGRRRTHGWTWVIDQDGGEGWVPDRCLAPI